MEAGLEPPTHSSTLPPPVVETFPLPLSIPFPSSHESSSEEPPHGRDVQVFRHYPITRLPIGIPDSSLDYYSDSVSDMSSYHPSHLDPVANATVNLHHQPQASTMRGAIFNKAEFTK